MADDATPPPSDAAFEAAWTALTADWDNDTRHRGFVGVAASSERLPEAAKRYRAALADPARKVRAQQGLDKILGVAMQSLTPVARDEPARSSVLGVAFTALVVTLAVTVVLAQATGFRALLSPLVILGEIVVIALVPWRRFSQRS
jgi:hypothetical protein